MAWMKCKRNGTQYFLLRFQRVKYLWFPSSTKQYSVIRHRQLVQTASWQKPTASENVYQSYVFGLVAIIGDDSIIKSNTEISEGRYGIMRKVSIAELKKNRWGKVPNWQQPILIELDANKIPNIIKLPTNHIYEIALIIFMRKFENYYFCKILWMK